MGTAVGLATGAGSDEVGLGEAVALAVDGAVGLGTGVAIDPVGLGVGVGSSEPVATAERDGEAPLVTCRAVD